ncbi:hypothetical protein B296_00037583 [Ensete ventricosum]|uniref:Uncharacterized protein n=1 Tax=Ensete ventricosum TaxID=4639 RepID=A0A426Y0R6_ENSVE|nr:hypothetical protein B296_00037583 [Ensete ventricosum]
MHGYFLHGRRLCQPLPMGSTTLMGIVASVRNHCLCAHHLYMQVVVWAVGAYATDASVSIAYIVFASIRPLSPRSNYDRSNKLQPDDGLRSSLGIGPDLDDEVRSRRSSLGDSPKGSGSSLRTHWEITRRRSEDSSQECRRLLDWQDKPPVSSGCTVAAQAFGQLTMVDLPRLGS